MIEASFEIDSSQWDRLSSRWDEFEAGAKTYSAQSIVELAQKIVKIIQEEYVPVGDTGRLQRSVDSDKIPLMNIDLSTFDTTYTVAIWAGAPGSGAEEYAVRQHEDLTFKHKIGGAKYIEIPVNLIGSNELSPILAKYVREFLNA